MNSRLYWKATIYELNTESWVENEELYSMRGKDVFFRSLVKAFANHHPFVISPDMIWLVICQEFALYVNQNAEELRGLIVGHEGKKKLTVESATDILTEETDWAGIFDSFERQLRQNTKGELFATLTADFSTTTQAERIASQITSMNVANPYFDFHVYYMICGIPFITLKGSADDWKKLQEKTMKLADYGLGWWVKILKPILNEFVEAAEGKPRQEFWQNIVSKKHPDYLRGMGCLPERPSRLNGWILKFFPFDHEGGIQKSVESYEHMMPEMVRVPFNYVLTDGVFSETTPMELWAGFVGYKEDKETCAIEPKIGWIVRKANSEEEIKKMIEEG